MCKCGVKCNCKNKKQKPIIINTPNVILPITTFL